MLVIGAGVIGLELGSVWRRLGAEVTVVEFLDRILPGIDSEVGRQTQRLLEKQGMTFKLGSKVTGVDSSGKKLKAKIEPAKGGAAETIEADVVLVSIGRVPYIEGLGLKEAGVAVDERGRVAVDDHFQTNVKGIYAIGDAIRGLMLAHKAEDEGVAVAEILAGQAGHVNYDVIPNVVYTYPEIASVGKSEDELKAAGIGLQCRKISVHRQWPRQGQSADRRLRQNPRRRQDRSRARRAHRLLGCRQHDRARPRSRWNSARHPKTSRAPATRIRRCRKPSRKPPWRSRSARFICRRRPRGGGTTFKTNAPHGARTARSP